MLQSAPTSLEIALSKSSRDISKILESCLADGHNSELSREDSLKLFATDGKDLQAVLETADEIRQRRVGDNITFVVVRNINFTNICYTGCRFCGFAKKEGDAEAELLSFDEIADRAAEAWSRGATEVCIQGGLHPKIPGTHYRDILVAIKNRIPEMHIHAFSPFEIKFGAGKCRMNYADYIMMLKDHGLGTIPGTAAEILDTDIRETLTHDKLKAHEWVDIIKTAHRAGIRTSSTMMYGHVDAPEHWVAHIALLRDIQKETGGFTEFVPLGFVHWDAPLYYDGKTAAAGVTVRPGPTREENLKVHAIARLMLQGWIDNIQVSWVKLGPRVAQYILKHGANDFGGTLMNETISRSSGAPYGEEITPVEFCRLIREIGRIPVQRNTVYETVEVFDDHDPVDYGTLKPKTARQLELTGL